MGPPTRHAVTTSLRVDHMVQVGTGSCARTLDCRGDRSAQAPPEPIARHISQCRSGRFGPTRQRARNHVGRQCKGGTSHARARFYGLCLRDLPIYSPPRHAIGLRHEPPADPSTLQVEASTRLATFRSWSCSSRNSASPGRFRPSSGPTHGNPRRPAIRGHCRFVGAGVGRGLRHVRLQGLQDPLPYAIAGGRSVALLRFP
jgi:hypothetical protein